MQFALPHLLQRPLLPRCHPKSAVMCAITLASVVFCTKQTFSYSTRACGEREVAKDKEMAEYEEAR